MLNDEVIACGTAPTRPVLSGTATSIATGGPLPRGADAVVMVEHSEPAGNARDRDPPCRLARDNIVSYAGSDIARGEALLRAGTVIGSREIGMLAACGLGRSRRGAPAARGGDFHRRRTGAARAAPLRPAGDLRQQRRDRHGGGDRERRRGGFSRRRRRRRGRTRSARCAEALATWSTCWCCHGGTSKGAGDVSPRASSRRLGKPGIVAHGVALKPGKPLCLAVVRRQAGGDRCRDFRPRRCSPSTTSIVPVLRRMAGLPPRADAEGHGRSAGADRIRTSAAPNS